MHKQILVIQLSLCILFLSACYKSKEMADNSKPHNPSLHNNKTICQATIGMMIDKTFMLDFNKETFKVIKKDDKMEVNYVVLLKDNKVVHKGYYKCEGNSEGQMYSVTGLRNWKN